jgi:TP901 family phage tail tape measure protein
MPPTTHEIGLGVVFSGRIDKSLQQAVTFLQRLFAGTGAATAAANALTKINTAQEKVGASAKVVGKQIGALSDHFDRLAGAVKVVFAYGVASTAMYGMFRAIKAGVTQTIEYDQALRNLRAIIGASAVEAEIMGEKIQKVSANSKFSIKEVSDAAIILGQAGLNTAEVMATLEAVINLSQGTMENMATTADLLTTVMRAYGKEAINSGEISDIMANAINKSKLTVDSLRIAFNYVGPVAYKAGISLNDTTAAMMLLSNAGIRASTIGTGLRQVISRLIAPNEKLRQAFNEAGIDLKKLNPEMNSFSDIVDNLSKVIPTATKAFELFGLRGAPVVAVLTTAGKEGFETMLKYTYEVGSAAEMAKVQLGGLQAALAALGNKFAVVSIQMGEAGFAGVLRVLVNILNEVVDLLGKLAGTGLGAYITNVLALSAAFGTLALSIKYISKLWLMLMAQIPGVFRVPWAILITRFNAAAAAVWLWVKAMIGLDVATVAVGKSFKALWAAINLFFKLNPWARLLLALAIIGSAIIGILNNFDMMEKRLNRQIFAAEQAADTYKGYAKELDKVQKGSDAYIALVQRMIKEHPELQKVIKDTQGNVVALRQALLSLADEKIKTALRDAIALVKELSEPTAYEEASNALAGIPTDMAVNMKSLDVQFLKIANAMVKLGKTSDTTLMEITDMVTDMGFKFNDAFMAEMAVAIKKWIDILTKAKVEMTGFKIEALDIPKTYIKIFKEMNVAQQAEAIQIMRRVNEQRAQLEKTWQDTAEQYGGDARYLEAQIADVLAKGLEQFGELSKKGEMTAADLARYKMTLLTALRQEMIDQTNEQIAQLDKYDKEEREQFTKSAKFQRGDHKDLHEDLMDQADRYWESREKIEEIGAARLAAIDNAINDLRLTQDVKFEEKAIDLQIRAARLREAAAVEEDDKIRAHYKVRLLEIQKFQQDQFETRVAMTKEQEDQLYSEIAEMEKEATAERDRALTEYEIKLGERRLELQKSVLELGIAEEERAAAETVSLWFESGEKKAQAEVEVAQMTLALRKQNYDKLKAMDNVSSMEILAAKIAVNEAAINLEEKQTAQIILIRRNALKQLEKDSAAYWDAQIEEARAKGATVQELMVLQAQKLEETKGGGFVEGFKAAFYRIAGEAKTFAAEVSGYFVDAMKQAAETVADTLTDFFLGEKKDINDIWRDLLKDMLREWNRMMMRMALARLAAGISGMFSGGETPYIPASHEGGVVGQEVSFYKRIPDIISAALPRFHSGLGSDEILSVLKKGEVVFTPGQMKALGDAVKSKEQGGNTLTINVPISVDDPMRQKRLASNLRTNVEAEVRRTLRMQMAY